MVSDDVLRELVRAGTHAISADNSQPWRFRLHSAGLDLLLVEQEPAMFFDPASAASLISCGAVLENLRLVAGLLGLRADIQRNPAWQQDRRVASIALARGVDAPDPLASQIYQRATHRGYYRRWHPVPPIARQRIASALTSFPECRLHWFERGQQRRTAQRLITAADRLRFTHEQVHHEFHASLRFGSEATARRDGLAWDTLGIERVFLPILRWLAPWVRTRQLNRLGLHYLMALRGAWLPLTSAPAIGALVQEGDPDYLRAGQALQRVWLAATEQGLAFQPFGPLPLFLLRMRELDGMGFDARQKMMLNTLQDDLWQLLEGDPAEQTLVMFFRVGFASPVKATSRRWPVDHFVIGKAGQ